MPQSETPNDVSELMHSFTTERLLIRPLLADDEDFFCYQLTNEKVMRHTGGSLSSEEANKAFQRYLRANQRAINGGKKSVITWAIVCLKSETIIGTQTLSFLILPHNAITMNETEVTDIKQAEIGIMLSPKANGKLFPEEAMGALMEYAFTQLKISRINAFYNSRNLATKRFVNKLGFNPATAVNDHSKSIDHTHYQYFDHEQWLQQLITKVFPATK
ncbi:N-acetyltransferase [Colwellia sp. 75C3]|uniref:GNAT family N-acetyltransferase n=1 Tax=Colwellia sp. 75C3 TaxID=888425 RepID=UPI000C3274B7|nr:GNAT family N-acetyltransferase [Colwellia sp. 75C3]PKG83192.1 N-acetyltransferase [Colwellia sp. 75C3]